MTTSAPLRAPRIDPAVPIDTLRHLENNPRRGDIDAIARSLDRFGQTKPIVVNTTDRTVLAGNHTLAGAAQLGWDTIAVAWVDFDPATAAAYALADNRTAELGTYDPDHLATLIAEVDAAEDEALRIATAWTDDDLAEIIADTDRRREGQTPLDAVPDTITRRTAAGDIWQCGPHRVACGDATDPAIAARLLDGTQVDCLWTDPPYGVSYVEVATSGHDLANPINIAGDDLDNDELAELLADAFDIAAAHMRPGAPFYMTGPPGPQIRSFLEIIDATPDLTIRQILIWVKDRAAFGRSDYSYQHETILWGETGPPPAANHDAIAYGWKDGAAHPWYGGHGGTSVIFWPKPSRNEHHPTQKPVELIATMIENSTKPGATIYDPFAGSGSTLIAAAHLGRVAAVTELDPGHCDTIIARWEEWSGEEATRIADG